MNNKNQRLIQLSSMIIEAITANSRHGRKNGGFEIVFPF